MPRENKYRKGVTIKNVAAFDTWVNTGQWTYLRGKVMHPGFICSMSYRTISHAIKEGAIKIALLNEEGKRK